jgi:2-keto-myo-inositol isomerase
MPRFGLNGATTGEGVGLEADLRLAADAGYQGVELRDTKIARYLASGGTLEAARDLARTVGVDVLSVNALEDATLRTGDALAQAVERCRLLARWARALDCPTVVAVPSVLPPGGLAAATVRARTVEALRALVAAAAESGVRVGFEFLGFPTCSVNTLRAARDVLDELGHPDAGLVIDAFHVYAGGSSPDDLDGLDGARIFMVHLDDAEPGPPSELRDAHRLLPGRGVVPLAPLIERVQRTGYTGAYSLELFRPEYWTWDPGVLARQGLESMRRLFA